MRRVFIASALFLMATSAHADMYDYGLKFTNQAQAIADATMLAGQYDGVNATWVLSHTIPGLQCWRPSQDMTVANPSPPPATIVQHTFLVGYFVIVSVNTAAPIPALLNHAALQFALDRTAREAGQAFVVKNNIGVVITDIACQPMFQSGSPYPMGGFN